MSTFTADNAAGATTPELVLGYAGTRESRNIVHSLISGGVAVSLIAPAGRSGEFQLLYETEADAFDALDLFAEETSFTITGGEIPAVEFTFVVTDSTMVELDDDTRAVWVVTLGYQEVDAP